MTKGVRQFALSTFNKYLPQLEKLGGTEFRRKVMNLIQEKFETTVASAATNYNFAFQQAREENPNAVIGLGRNPITAASTGARPKKVAATVRKTQGQLVTVARETSGVVVAEGVSRRTANSMVANSGGRGKPRLIIQEDQE